MWCKLFGHKWDLYKEDIQHITSVGAKLNLPIFMGKSVSINVSTEFRFCLRCFLKQQRFHHTGKETDWKDCQLGKEENRQKKLKELGI